MAAAYAVAFQLVIAGFAASHLSIAADDFSGDLFITCLGHQSSDLSDQGVPGKRPVDQSSCVFCTVASANSAIIPVDCSATVASNLPFSQIMRPSDDQVVAYVSPTGQYQRGPPARVFAAG